MKPVTRFYRLDNGRVIKAEDACHALRLFVDIPPIGLKSGTYHFCVASTGEKVIVNWDGTKATMVWPEDKQ